MGRQSILIVETKDEVRELISRYLMRDGYLTIQSGSCKDALEYLTQHPIDLILLNIDLPDGNGWSLFSQIRAHLTVPIIFLSEYDNSVAKILGFDLGGEDFITIPFDPRELLARINVVLRRRVTIKPKNENFIVAGPYHLNHHAKELYVNNVLQKLPRREYDLLEHLIINQNIAFTRFQLLESVWGDDFTGDIRTVDTHIKKLREKLDPEGSYIQTIWGVGYKLKVL